MPPRPAPRFPVQLLTDCPACDGYGCTGCADGKVGALCAACRAPAFHLIGLDPFCPACFYLCEICDHTTADDDRLPFGPGWAHASCAVARSLESLPNPGNPREHANADASERAPEYALGRALAGDDAVPRTSPKLIEMWARRGYITTAAAVELSGHALATIYVWINEGKLRAERSGLYHFVELASLEALCPQVRHRRVAVQ